MFKKIKAARTTELPKELQDKLGIKLRRREGKYLYKNKDRGNVESANKASKASTSKDRTDDYLKAASTSKNPSQQPKGSKQMKAASTKPSTSAQSIEEQRELMEMEWLEYQLGYKRKKRVNNKGNGMVHKNDNDNGSDDFDEVDDLDGLIDIAERAVDAETGDWTGSDYSETESDDPDSDADPKQQGTAFQTHQTKPRSLESIKVKGLLNRFTTANISTLLPKLLDLQDPQTSEVIVDFLDTILLKPATRAGVGFQVTYAAVAVAWARFDGSFTDILMQRVRSYLNTFDCHALNAVSLMAYLYTFGLLSVHDMFDLIRRCIAQGQEGIEPVLTILKICGGQLRRTDPASLGDIVKEVEEQVDDKATLKTRFMLERLMDLRNNKTKHEEEHGQIVRYLESMKGQESMVEMPKRQILESKSHTHPSNYEQLARKMGMNTQIRRDIFCHMMQAADYRQAHERISGLGLNSTQSREITRVIMFCAGHEKTWNPYYALLLGHFLENDKRQVLTLRYTTWDFLRNLGEFYVTGQNKGSSDAITVLKKSQVFNTAQLLGTLVGRAQARLDLFKPVIFHTATKDTLKFFTQLFITAFKASQMPDPDSQITAYTKRDVKKIQDMFDLQDTPELLSGLHWFLKNGLHEKTLSSLDADTRILEQRPNERILKSETYVLELHVAHEAVQAAVNALNGPSTALNGLKQQSQTFLAPSILACRSQNARIATMGLSIMQKLVQLDVINADDIDLITNCLRDTLHMPVETQLKLLQTILLLFVHLEVYSDATVSLFMLCFRLQDLRNPTVASTATATLRQLITRVFDKVQAEKAEYGPALIDAQNIFTDLCLLSAGEKAQFLHLSALSKTFALDALRECLDNFQALFKQKASLKLLLSSHLIPCILKGLAAQSPFAVCIRLYGVMETLLKHFMDSLAVELEVFWGLLVKGVLGEGENFGRASQLPDWMRALSLETVRSLGSMNTILEAHALYDSDGGSHITGTLLLALAKTAEEGVQHISISSEMDTLAVSPLNSQTPRQSYFETITAAAGSAIGLSTTQVDGFSLTSELKTPLKDQLDRFEMPPQLPRLYLQQISVQILFSLLDQFEKLELSQRQEHVSVWRDLWPPALKVLTSYFPLAIKDDLFNRILHEVITIARISYELVISSAIQTSLDLLLSSVVPPHTNTPNLTPIDQRFRLGSRTGGRKRLMPRNFASAVTLVDLVKIAQESFEEETWLRIFGCIQIVYLAFRTERSRVASEAAGTISSDSRTLTSAMDDLFLNLQQLSLSAYHKSIRALCQFIIADALSAKPYSRSSEDSNDSRNGSSALGMQKLSLISPGSTISPRGESYLLSQMQKSLFDNQERVAPSAEESSLNSVEECLETLLTEREADEALRIQASNMLCVFKLKLRIGSDQKHAQSYGLEHFNLLATVSDDLEEYAPFRKAIQEILLDHLQNFIEQNAQTIGSNWPVVFQLLSNLARQRTDTNGSQMADNETKISINSSPPSQKRSIPRHYNLSKAFKTLGLIANDFMEDVGPDHWNDYIKTCVQFGTQESDTNIAMASTGLLMKIGDLIAQGNRNQQYSLIAMKALDQIASHSQSQVQVAAISSCFAFAKMAHLRMSTEEIETMTREVFIEGFCNKLEAYVSDKSTHADTAGVIIEGLQQYIGVNKAKLQGEIDKPFESLCMKAISAVGGAFQHDEHSVRLTAVCFLKTVSGKDLILCTNQDLAECTLKAWLTACSAFRIHPGHLSRRSELSRDLFAIARNLMTRIIEHTPQQSMQPILTGFNDILHAWPSTETNDRGALEAQDAILVLVDEMVTLATGQNIKVICAQISQWLEFASSLTKTSGLDGFVIEGLFHLDAFVAKVERQQASLQIEVMSGFMHTLTMLIGTRNATYNSAEDHVHQQAMITFGHLMPRLETMNDARIGAGFMNAIIAFFNADRSILLSLPMKSREKFESFDQDFLRLVFDHLALLSNLRDNLKPLCQCLKECAQSYRPDRVLPLSKSEPVQRVPMERLVPWSILLLCELSNVLPSVDAADTLCEVFRGLIANHLEDRRWRGSRPLPRLRIFEIHFVVFCLAFIPFPRTPAQNLSLVHQLAHLSALPEMSCAFLSVEQITRLKFSNHPIDTKTDSINDMPLRYLISHALVNLSKI